jgi:glycosyltransferase involved in cell wall biosynthesis
MKVMSVVNLIPRKLGSFEEYTISLSRSLTAQGGQSILVFNGLPSDALRPRYTQAGAILETKPFNPFSRESAGSLSALVRRYQPEVIHLHFVSLLSLDIFGAALSRSARIVFSEHSSDIPKERTALKTFLLRSAKRAFAYPIDAFVTPSNYVKNRLVGEGISRRKVTTIHNGVNLEMFNGESVTEDIRAKYGFGPGTVILVSISQVIPEKGIPPLIDAAAIALKQGADVGFIHVGDGHALADSRAKVQELGIEKRFIFTGVINLPEIASILRQSDIFTLPCTWGEAFSLAILEALAAGKPAIVTRTGGNIEAVEDQRNGFVVPPGDVTALAAAIMALYQNPERRRLMGQESLTRSHYFSVKRWVDETISLYSRMQ